MRFYIRKLSCPFWGSVYDILNSLVYISLIRSKNFETMMTIRIAPLLFCNWKDILWLRVCGRAEQAIQIAITVRRRLDVEYKLDVMDGFRDLPQQRGPVRDPRRDRDGEGPSCAFPPVPGTVVFKGTGEIVVGGCVSRLEFSRCLFLLSMGTIKLEINRKTSGYRKFAIHVNRTANARKRSNQFGYKDARITRKTQKLSTLK